ncbi:hypothetical protein PHLCEN_2v4627 [Hermanssonia centrifuga]|uniref:Uncharacterized protein n=1 Tax=Hermanssonia centrifuga TaxID=98765 RepID=A0A2R6PMU1_9APHY|nr:hypothetical protein PHLCEN_2v4627 [Hermanssonia centrifuga]
MPRGGTKTEERARLPTNKPKDRGPSHSDATPNWALAPDGVTDEKDEDDGRRRPDRGKGVNRGGVRKTGRQPRSSEGSMMNLSSPTIQKNDPKRRCSEASGTRAPNIQNKGIDTPERMSRPYTPNSEPSALAAKLKSSRASTPCSEGGPRQNPSVADVNSLIQELNSARVSHKNSLNVSPSISNNNAGKKTSTTVPGKAPMGGPQQDSSPSRSSAKVSAADCDTWSSFILGIQANEGKSSDGCAQQSIQRTPGVPSAPLSASLNVTPPVFFPAGMRPVDSLTAEDRNAWIPALDSNTPTRPRSQTPEWRRPDSVSRDSTSKTQAVGKWTSRSRMGSPLSSATTGRPPFSASLNMPGSRNLDNNRTHSHEPGAGDISGGERRWPTLEEICAVNASSS